MTGIGTVDCFTLRQSGLGADSLCDLENQRSFQTTAKHTVRSPIKGERRSNNFPDGHAITSFPKETESGCREVTCITHCLRVNGLSRVYRHHIIISDD